MVIMVIYYTVAAIQAKSPTRKYSDWNTLVSTSLIRRKMEKRLERLNAARAKMSLTTQMYTYIKFKTEM